MKKYLVDTNVIWDLLLDREPFAENAGKIFDAAYKGDLELYVCSLSYSNIYYIMRPVCGKVKTLSVLAELMESVSLLPVDSAVIQAALSSKFNDFEDAIQYYSAYNSKNIDGIITRNIKDFRLSNIAVFTPQEVSC